MPPISKAGRVRLSPAAAMLNEPLGLRELAALVFTLGGVAMALRS